MPGIIPDQDYGLFCDETGISQDRFMVVGGIVAHKNRIPEIHETMEEYRRKFYMNAELKWSKVSNQKFNEYKALVDYFFALNNKNYIKFHCVIFDNHQWNHRLYNEGDGDVGISKLYYQLILHGGFNIHSEHHRRSVSRSRRPMLQVGC